MRFWDFLDRNMEIVGVVALGIVVMGGFVLIAIFGNTC